jgi:hypothetical protein
MRQWLLCSLMPSPDDQLHGPRVRIAYAIMATILVLWGYAALVPGFALDPLVLLPLLALVAGLLDVRVRWP